MPAYTYIGDDASMTLRGITFPQGEAVEVTDKDMEAKLDPLPYFTSDKPEPEMVPAVASNEDLLAIIAQKDARIAELEAELYEPAPTLGTTTPSADTEPLFKEGQMFVDGLMVTEVPESDFIDLPDDWRSIHHSTRIKIAKSLPGGEDVTTVSDADAIIELEIERRDNAN